MISLLENLNESQKEAVEYIDSPLLVLSGAGTGKTRVITYKIAYLIKKKIAQPERIFAVTFTNKAADEMKKRIYDLIGEKSFDIWLGTFHSNALRILRRDGHLLGLPSNFTIIDQDDRLALIRNILKRVGIDDKKYPPKMYLNIISNYKNSINFVKKIDPQEYIYRFNDVFYLYNEELKRSALIDFDDMLSLTLRLFYENKDILQFYSHLFEYILVDEFQDTNNIQFEFLKALRILKDKICVVGDDDQSIYGWRGAEVGNIVFFDKYFKNTKIIRLENNYRSAPKILYLANNLISNNKFRKGKSLKPEINIDAEILLNSCLDEKDEANFVVKKIEKLVQEYSIPLNEIAVLYRTNAQSRNFEVALNHKNIPYQVIGSISFYQRKEIKDILSYLRFYNNKFDTTSMIRALKNPPKGIGDKTIAQIIEIMNEKNLSAYDSIVLLTSKKTAAASKRLQNFIDIIDGIKQHTKISDMIKHIVDKTDYINHIKKTEDIFMADNRIYNINELINSAVSYEESTENISLTDFLATTTLQTSTDEMDNGSVKLMTLHSAKGLEFEAVFLVGLEDGLFPLFSSMDEDEKLEEERRLCYVGITRAKRFLYLTYAKSRLIYGKRQDCYPSQFLDEMRINQIKGDQTKKDGSKVIHPKYGKGVIISIKGNGDDAKADVIFENSGIKKMALKFLKFI
ncbi:ATP-dependent DNA helicase PcrA [Deferribacter desulfuricans SSM1]|uniref:DNA 3'-5' helicase n=1 Tax=Deferribacter desulfuricans (strain DSM 14783 / JCM 11476 / NBRC 101012 / SSM1) TaxID=639282 RepID=D3P9L0_DEFDS|nr:UvrD-helicase domain-containing protein [Deferribacter desulfuricans]BAI81400.1 ATP-dependent DNA helicase PcrA [Deferribacter desulfuricans SSM1]